jgi:uncharacterized membrane protein
MAAHPVVMEPRLVITVVYKDEQAMTTNPAQHRAVPSHHPVVNRLDAERAKDFQLRLADRITTFVGSMPFVYLHVLLFGLWMVVFEQSPWPTLTLTVSLEAIFLSSFVMIGQNRQAVFQQAKADHEYLEGEQELKLNTELTRAIDELTREVHERIVGNASTTSGVRAPLDLPDGPPAAKG